MTKLKAFFEAIISSLDGFKTVLKKLLIFIFGWLPFFWPDEPKTAATYLSRLYYNVGFQAVVFLASLLVALVIAVGHAADVAREKSRGSADSPVRSESPVTKGAESAAAGVAPKQPNANQGEKQKRLEGECLTPYQYDDTYSHPVVGLLFVALLTATIGAVANNYRRVSQLASTDIPLEKLPDWYVLNFQLWISPLFAMIFGFLLIALFASGLVRGDLFPAYNNGASCFDNVPWLLRDMVPLRNADAVRVIVWCFIAGFFEGFVPNILDTLVASANPPATPSRGSAITSTKPPGDAPVAVERKINGFVAPEKTEEKEKDAPGV